MTQSHLLLEKKRLTFKTEQRESSIWDRILDYFIDMDHTV